MNKPSNINAASAAEPKWFANINDVSVPAPRRVVSAALLKQLSNIPEDNILVRDHNDKKSDIHLSDPEEVDLAEGNVFYSINRCMARSREDCSAPAKLSVLVDDEPKIILKKRYSARMLRDLYLITGGTNLLRDYESPSDEIIDPDTKLNFADGPVFVTRKSSQVTIHVNTESVTVEKCEITYTEIVSLAYANFDFSKYAYTVTYKDGCPNQPEGQLTKGDSVHITQGMKFNVARSDKS